MNYQLVYPRAVVESWRSQLAEHTRTPDAFMAWLQMQPLGSVVGHARHNEDSVTALWINTLPIAFPAESEVWSCINHISINFPAERWPKERGLRPCSISLTGQPAGVVHPQWIHDFEYQVDQDVIDTPAYEECMTQGSTKLLHETPFPITREQAIAVLNQVTAKEAIAA